MEVTVRIHSQRFESDHTKCGDSVVSDVGLTQALLQFAKFEIGFGGIIKKHVVCDGKTRGVTVVTSLLGRYDVVNFSIPELSREFADFIDAYTTSVSKTPFDSNNDYKSFASRAAGTLIMSSGLLHAAVHLLVRDHLNPTLLDLSIQDLAALIELGDKDKNKIEKAAQELGLLSV